EFPYLLWQLVNGERIVALRGRPGVRWVRALTDIPVSLGEVLRGRMSIAKYLASLRGPIEFAILAADDPLPAIVEVPSAMYLACSRRVRDPEVHGARPLAASSSGGAPRGGCLSSRIHGGSTSYRVDPTRLPSIIQ